VIETLSPDGREDLTRVRELTDRPVGANVALLAMQDPAIVEILVDAGEWAPDSSTECRNAHEAQSTHSKKQAVSMTFSVAAHVEADVVR
jgi:hypothetical protein